MDPWTHATKRALGIGNWWEGMVAKLGLRVSARDSSGVEQVGEMASGQELAEQQHIEDMDFNGVDVDILDDPWMMELLGGGYDFNTEPQMW
jgi:hypothetical protein